MAERNDLKYMYKALALASKGMGKALPNPMVGAVLVKGDKVVGEGYHKGPGSKHAETAAIAKAGRNAAGSTLYVNLEPCCHTGRTGPCTEAIIQAGIKKIVYAATDPNPKVNGKGARMLRRAGVQVSNGLLSQEAIRFNDAYMGVAVSERPYVTVKLAMSLDGRIATSTGDSKWISNMKSRRFVHRLRSKNQAVMVGMGTVRKDNPSLTTRLVKGENPYRIVVGSSLKNLEKFKLFRKNNDFKTILASSPDNLERKKIEKVSKRLISWDIKKIKNGRIDLKDLLMKAQAFGIYSILVEGGAELVSSLLRAQLVDKLIIITAPVILGEGVSAIGDLGVTQMNKGLRFNDQYRFNIDGDEVFVGYPDWSR